MAKSVALEILESRISEAVNAKVEITIRGVTQYTISTETVVNDLHERVKRYFEGYLVNSSVSYDEETGSFVYITVKE